MDDIISRTVPRGELLAQLAEECSELAQAALKLRRAVTPGASPTEVGAEMANIAFREECADVLLTMRYATGGDVVIRASEDIMDTARHKARRWAERLSKRRK